MDRLYFNISELTIHDRDIPLDVANKLLRHHIWVMNPIREKLGGWITASQRSGFRSRGHELSMGRNGNSQHTFQGLGAVDWTCDRVNIRRLLALMKDTPYTRIAFYPNNNFIHADYVPVDGGKQFFRCNSPTSPWVRDTLTNLLR